MSLQHVRRKKSPAEELFDKMSELRPEEKIRQFLAYLSEPTDLYYFQQDGFPRENLHQDAKKALVFFDKLIKK